MENKQFIPVNIFPGENIGIKNRIKFSIYQGYIYIFNSSGVTSSAFFGTWYEFMRFSWNITL